MTTKEKFTERYLDQVQLVNRQLLKVLNNAIKSNALDFENMEDNYAAIYPLLAAALEECAADVIKTSISLINQKEHNKRVIKFRSNPEIWQQNWIK